MLSHCLCSYCSFYWTIFPAVLESGEPNKVCMSLIKPSEPLDVTITMTSEEQNYTIFTQTEAKIDTHFCKEYKVKHSGG